MKYKDMKPEEIEETRKLIQGLCICKTCPTWDECAKEIGFCFPGVGKNRCIRKDLGCICEQCPASEKFGFNQEYYCIVGPQKERWDL